MTRDNPATLAVHLTRYGVAFVYITRGYVLHDWSTVGVRGPRKHHTIMRTVRALVARLQPEMLVLEDAAFRRAQRVRTTLRALARYAARAGIPYTTVTRADVRAVGAPFDAATKHTFNQLVAATFPALTYRVPRKRRAWDPEPYGQGVFDAAAFAIVFFVRECGFTPSAFGVQNTQLSG